MFTAIWCPACLIMRPRINELLDHYNVHLKTEYDYDIDEKEVKDWEIGNILPVTIIIDENNQEKLRIIGEKNKKELVKILDSVLVGK